MALKRFVPRVLFASTLAALAASGSVALADPTAADLLLARQLGTEGVDLAQKGDCPAALAKLERAEAIHHAPTLLLHIGECQTRLGHHVDALSSLDRVAHENLGPTPPRAFVNAQQRAAALIEEVRPKVGTLRIDASGSRAGVTFQLDGAELKEAALGLDRIIDPGTHVIEAATSDGKRVRRSVDIAQGGREAVVLELPAPPPAAPAAAVTVPTAPAPERSSNLRTVGWALSGVGAAGIVTSAIFAGITLSSKSSLDGACADKVCPPSSRSDYDAAKTTATVSGVALVVGVVALGAGVYILVTRKGERAAAQSTSPWRSVATTGRFAF